MHDSIICTATGLEDFEANGSLAITIYPNPATTEITLEISSAVLEKRKIQITDALGNVILRESFSGNQNKTDVRKLAAGIYFIEVFGEKQKWYVKFVKE